VADLMADLVAKLKDLFRHSETLWLDEWFDL